MLVARADEVSVDRRDQGGKPIPAGLSLSPLLVLEPFLPVLQPGVVILALVQVDVEAPIYSTQPLIFQSIQLADRDAADFGPRLVLEGIVVQKLTPEEQGDGEHTPNLAFAVVDLAGGSHHVGPLGEVVHAEQDSGAWKTGRSQDLGDELPEGSVHGSSGRDDAGGHVGNVVGHELDLVVEDLTHTARHFVGWDPEDQVKFSRNR